VAADAAGDLVRQLQALKESDRMPPHPVDLTRTLNSLKDLSRRLVHPDTPLSHIWPESPLWIKGDPASLEFLIVGGLSWFAGMSEPVTLSAGAADGGGRVDMSFTCQSCPGLDRDPAWRRDRPVFSEVVHSLDADWELIPEGLRFSFQTVSPPEESM